MSRMGRGIGAAVVAAAVALTAGAESVGADQLKGTPGAELDPAVITIDRMMELGTALLIWELRREKALTEEERARFQAHWETVLATTPPWSPGAPWGPPPGRSLAADEVRALLQPEGGQRLLEAIPERDGWGRPLVIVANLEGLLDANVFAILSPGENGTFEGPSYRVGSCAPGSPDDDIVWSDGFFERWPALAARHLLNGPGGTKEAFED